MYAREKSQILEQRGGIFDKMLLDIAKHIEGGISSGKRPYVAEKYGLDSTADVISGSENSREALKWALSRYRGAEVSDLMLQVYFSRLEATAKNAYLCEHAARTVTLMDLMQVKDPIMQDFNAALNKMGKPGILVIESASECITPGTEVLSTAYSDALRLPMAMHALAAVPAHAAKDRAIPYIN